MGGMWGVVQHGIALINGPTEITSFFLYTVLTLLGPGSLGCRYNSRALEEVLVVESCK